MITLDIKDYCHDCPMLDPGTDKIYADGKVMINKIYCSNERLCEHIADHLKSHLKEGKDEEV